MKDLPERFRAPGAEDADAVADAVQVWRLGAAYPPEPAGGLGSATGPFTGVAPPLRDLLRDSATAKSAVQFSCAGTHAYEDAVARALETSAEPAVRLIALAALVRVRAPRSVASQWQAVGELREAFAEDPRAAWLLDAVARAFDAEAIRQEFERAPPAERLADDTRQQWAVRVAGVRGLDGFVPRLRDLAACDNLGASLAAVESLGEIPGDAADEALDHCVRAWHYDAYVRAATRLLRRDPARLRRTLREVEAPDDCRYQQGLFLGRLDDSAAVPHLCATVGQRALVDREMFDLIERLAVAEQLPLVEALPDHVRPEQADRAAAVAQAVRRRLNGD